MFPVALTATMVIEKGATFDPVLIIESGEPPALIDLTGCEAEVIIRPAFDSATVLEAFSTQNNSLAIDGPAGKISFDVPDEDTLAMAWTAGVFALYVDFPDNTTRCLLRGPAKVELGTRTA